MVIISSTCPPVRPWCARALRPPYWRTSPYSLPLMRALLQSRPTNFDRPLSGYRLAQTALLGGGLVLYYIPSHFVLLCASPRTAFPRTLLAVSVTYRLGEPVRAEHEFEHGRPAGALNVPAFFSTGQGMQVNSEFVNQASIQV